VVKISPDSLRRSSRGTISGEIWCEFDGESFPEARWDDLIVVVLGWWLESLSTLISGRKLNVDVRFLDGPFTSPSDDMMHNL